ncbi:MAG TPA: rRNA maturation RNase YbeY [Candidatus Acidoferrum sp.]|jgi:rRNA maturation RNase YbeY
MILNRQKKVRLAMPSFATFLRKLQRELELQNVDVSIAFVSDAEIARWNENYRHKEGPTDVLSFPAITQRKKKSLPARAHNRQTSGSPRKFLGDIAIAPETARRYAKKNGRTLRRELRILMLHGLLHLMGYDHESDNGEMNRIEQRLRRRLGLA